MKLNFCLTAILIGCSIYGTAKDYKISTAAELAALKLLPGDKVIVKNGERTNQQMVFRGNGTQQNPIKLIAEQGGQVFFTGASSLPSTGKPSSVVLCGIPA